MYSYERDKRYEEIATKSLVDVSNNGDDSSSSRRRRSARGGSAAVPQEDRSAPRPATTAVVVVVAADALALPSLQRQWPGWQWPGGCGLHGRGDRVGDFGPSGGVSGDRVGGIGPPPRGHGGGAGTR